jgi:hypothetical protein
MLIGIGIILALALLTSTRAGRAAAAEALKPFTRRVAIAAALLWLVILAGFIWPPRH